MTIQAKIIEEIKRTVPSWDSNLIAMYLAQMDHESQGFTVTYENLNYSKEGLQKTFPNYFSYNRNINDYVRNPERIANFVYADRMGNGNVRSGDGWVYRGRGFIQLTGFYNYRRMAELTGEAEILMHPDVVAEDEAINIKVSVAFLNSLPGFNSAAKQLDIDKATKLVNGGITDSPKGKSCYVNT